MIIVRIILDVLPEKQLEVRQTLLALVKSGRSEERRVGKECRL